MQITTSDEKSKLRKATRLKRKALTSEEQHQAASLMQQKLSRHEKVIPAKKIALYLTNDDELDPMPFIQWCWENGKQVYIPVLHPFCIGHILFLHFDHNTPMIRNKYGILEPKLDVTYICPMENLDIIFTPLVAFTESCNRLGMGGGFYDRTLANWFTQHMNSSIPPTETQTFPIQTPVNFYPIGIAHDCQQVDEIPTELWDIPLPEIITPTKIFINHNNF